jgi:hypothetical protein
MKLIGNAGILLAFAMMSSSTNAQSVEKPWTEARAKARIESLRSLHRPVICTEYMARGNGSTFDTILPVAKRERVAVINWGIVAGKTQTYLPWDSWKRPYVDIQPAIWFHDTFNVDGSPYRQREIDILRNATGRGTNVLPSSR